MPNKMGIVEKMQTKITKEPTILTAEDESYVIVGSVDHGFRIPDSSVHKLIDSLESVVALKMEGAEEILRLMHPMSTEILTRTSVGSAPVSFLKESDHEDIGSKLLQYGVPEELAEIYVPCLVIRYNDGVPPIEMLPSVFERYKQRFGFINIRRAMLNFLKVANYWEKNELDPRDLDEFSYDFEKFTGDVREHAFWMPDLKQFRVEYSGKIAVCSGCYHVPFVREILDGRGYNQPKWEDHIDNRREDSSTPQDPDFLKEIYKHLYEVLELS